MGSISSICVLALAAVASLPVSAQEPLWPVAENPLAAGRAYPEFVQPTASGEPDSALFGCVRNSGHRFHEALDIAPVKSRKKGEATDPVLAIHAGIIRHISTVSGNSSYGRYVLLEHPGLDLAIYSLYAHLAKVEPGLKAGMKVEAGQSLGIMGRSAGGYTIPRERAHLHLEVGLRLSGSFETWYRQQAYDNPNKHGNFNGMNLVSWNPLDYFQAHQAGRARSPLEYLESLPPAVSVHIYSARRPDFLDRYPELLLPGCEPSEQAGWEVLLTAWGLPLSFKPLRQAELNGVRAAGEISVVGVNRTALDEFACRDIVTEERGKVILGRGGQSVLELLFTPD